mmetsp:Transcript_13851/g.43764  ORF Transcript_13851/g.43764 Transcript_13851/m.43764 type:complete len:227 (+) Transcript_13851:604-1284(+)
MALTSGMRSSTTCPRIAPRPCSCTTRAPRRPPTRARTPLGHTDTRTTKSSDRATSTTPGTTPRRAVPATRALSPPALPRPTSPDRPAPSSALRQPTTSTSWSSTSTPTRRNGSTSSTTRPPPRRPKPSSASSSIASTLTSRSRSLPATPPAAPATRTTPTARPSSTPAATGSPGSASSVLARRPRVISSRFSSPAGALERSLGRALARPAIPEDLDSSSISGHAAP